MSVQQATIIHELLGQAFEASLRQQLLTGEFNAAILGKVLEWIKANNISVVEEADARLASLAGVFRSDHDDLKNYLDSITSIEI
ncbi:MAG: hypothetical protein GWP23_01865 [Synechococcales cyanobacterium H12SWP_bin.12]|nr:hypothetical protein [Synechococcales cyanobacterium H12SWP_bin.12]